MGQLPDTMLPLLLGLLNIALAAGLVPISRRLERARPWILLAAASFLLRGLSRLAEAFGVDEASAALLIDTVLAAVLIALLVALYRIARSVESDFRRTRDATGRALDAAAEYQRALYDYTQLVRHRMVNPLTAITAGLDTLYDLDLDALDRETRCEILEAMRGKAKELQDMILDPAQMSAEEHQVGLRPTPDLGGAGQEDRYKERAAETEIEFRGVNWARIASLAPGSAQRDVSFVCECSATSCSTPVTVPLHEYFRVHQHRDRFIVRVGHDVAALEEVLERHGEWLVIQKRGVGKELVDARPHPGDHLA